MAKNKKVEFTAQVCVSLWLEVAVEASSLQEALQIAAEQKTKDLVEFDSSVSCIDDVVTVVGASRSLPEPF